MPIMPLLQNGENGTGSLLHLEQDKATMVNAHCLMPLCLCAQGWVKAHACSNYCIHAKLLQWIDTLHVNKFNNSFIILECAIIKSSQSACLQN